MLKQKRLYESQREQLYNQQFNIEQTAFTMESAKDSVQTIQAMQVCCALLCGALLCCAAPAACTGLHL